MDVDAQQLMMSVQLPRLRSFNFFGMPATDKLFIHLIVAQLMLNDLPGQFTSSECVSVRVCQCTAVRASERTAAMTRSEWQKLQPSL